MKLDKQDAWIFILSTIRYSMGRRSYIVGLSQDLFHRYKSLLTTEQINQVYEEVSKELQIRKTFGGTLGGEMDHKSWNAFIRDGKEGVH